MARRAHPCSTPTRLLGALQRRNVSFVVIGAFARVVHGTRELTDGIDISPSMREENLARLEKALEDLDARRADGSRSTSATSRSRWSSWRRAPASSSSCPSRRARAATTTSAAAPAASQLGRGLRPQIASPDDLARMLGALDREDQTSNDSSASAAS